MDAFRSHRERKCEVSAGYRGEVWRSKLGGCGNPVDRALASVAAWKGLECPGADDDDGDDDGDDEGAE